MVILWVKYLVWFSLLNLCFVWGIDPTVPILYAQDYCHYATINHKIYINEEQPSVIIRASRGPYKPDLDCQLRIINSLGDENGLNINIDYINLRQSHRFRDYLLFKFNDKKTNLWYDERLIDNNRRKEEFFFTDSSDYSDGVVIKFMTTVENPFPKDDKDFEIIVTLFEFKNRKNFDKRDERKNCPKKLFDCGNNICIHRRFVCNGIENCGNGWDEPEICKHSRNNNYFDFFDSGFWFGFKIVMSLLLIGILLGIISCICKKYDENKKLKKQFLLEELNRHSGYRLRGNSIYSLNQKKTPLYPRLYRNYGGTEA